LTFISWTSGCCCCYFYFYGTEFSATRQPGLCNANFSGLRGC